MRRESFFLWKSEMIKATRVMILIVSMLSAMQLMAQQKSISGTVVDEKGEPVIGANVSVKGTTQGSITDLDGQFSLNAGQGATLVCSYIGYDDREVIVGNQTKIKIVLKESTHAIEEVVVTAMGIGKQKRSLSYSTQQVKMDDVNTIKSVNLGESLAGKIAGVKVNASSGATGVGGAPRIVIRGDRSIGNNNQPLVVVDGIIYGTDANALSSLNSDDIENINILKGATAAALYGSSANNGVIVVTTKKGSAGKSTIDFNSVTTMDSPYLYPEFQNEYGQGSSGQYLNTEMTSWGPRIAGQTYTDWTGKETKMLAQPNNVKDLFSAGYNLTNSISYSGGTDKIMGYFSYSNTTAKGVIENNKLQRNNFNLRLSAEPIKNLKVDVRVSYFQQNLDNAPAQGYSMYSPMSQLMRMPRTIRTEDIKDYVYYDDTFSRKQTTWAPGSTIVVNPYWSMHARELLQKNARTNVIGSIRYDFTSYLYAQVRGNLNASTSDDEEKVYADTPYMYYGKGAYLTGFGKSRRMIGDLLIGFNKDFGKGFNVNATVGAEINDIYGRSIDSSTGGDGLSQENKFALIYGIKPTTQDAESRIQKQSIFGTAQISWRNMLYLDVTGRTDWSSTLPYPHNYSYPSVGLVGVVSEMFQMPEFISFAKVRGTYAEVGNDAKFAVIYQTFSSSANGAPGNLGMGNAMAPSNLVPERTKSWEAGAEIKFFQNRLSVDFTWYKSNTFNQLLSITAPPGIGFSTAQVNCGNIQNRGIELMISGVPIQNKDFTWDVFGNFSKNKNTVLELAKGLKKFDLGDVSDMIGKVQVREGEPYGQIYAKGFERDDNGKVIVDALGLPKMTASGDAELMGNMNYDWTAGLTNAFNYKNWNLSFLIDLNYGGVRLSQTEAIMQLYGNGTNSLFGREGFVYDGVKADGTKNDISTTAQLYAIHVAARGNASVGELYKHDATNARLRELSVGYNFKFHNKVVKDLRLSLVGRNLFFLYNGCKWFDPDMTGNPSNNGMSGENALLPYARTFGFNIKLTL